MVFAICALGDASLRIRCMRETVAPPHQRTIDLIAAIAWLRCARTNLAIAAQLVARNTKAKTSTRAH